MKPDIYYMKSAEVSAMKYMSSHAGMISVWLGKTMVVEKDRVVKIPGTLCVAKEGDYIVKDKMGNIFSYTEEEFKKEFRKIDGRN